MGGVEIDLKSGQAGESPKVGCSLPGRHIFPVLKPFLLVDWLIARLAFMLRYGQKIRMSDCLGSIRRFPFYA